jgi:hypothetical protein
MTYNIFLNFPTYPKILKKVDPKLFFFLGSNSAEIASQSIWISKFPPVRMSGASESPLASYFSKIAPYSYPY